MRNSEVILFFFRSEDFFRVRSAVEPRRVREKHEQHAGVRTKWKHKRGENECQAMCAAAGWFCVCAEKRASRVGERGERDSWDFKRQ
jgi:hypothetical protein